MGLTAAERKALFKQTLAGEEGQKENSLISSGVKEENEHAKKPEEKKLKSQVQSKKEPKSLTKKRSNTITVKRTDNLENFFKVSKNIREQVDEEFGADENQLTYTTGLYPRYIAILKRMSKSVGISQGAIISAALCHMLDAFPEEEKDAIIKDKVNEIW